MDLTYLKSLVYGALFLLAACTTTVLRLCVACPELPNRWSCKDGISIHMFCAIFWYELPFYLTSEWGFGDADPSSLILF